MDWSDKSTDPKQTSDHRTWQKGLKAAGKDLSSSGQSMMDRAAQQAAANSDRQTPIPSYKRGGKVRKTGLARLHKGEVVIPRNKVKKVRKAMHRKSGSR